MIKVENEGELLSILKILSSEAVGLSKRMNENKDPTTQEYSSQFKKDEMMFGDLSEQEEEPLKKSNDKSDEEDLFKNI